MRFLVLHRFADGDYVFTKDIPKVVIFSPFQIISDIYPSLKTKSLILVNKLLVYNWQIIFPGFSLFYPSHKAFINYYTSNKKFLTGIRKFLASKKIFLKPFPKQLPLGLPFILTLLQYKLYGLTDFRLSVYALLNSVSKLTPRVIYFFTHNFSLLYSVVNTDHKWPPFLQWWVNSIRSFYSDFQYFCGDRFTFKSYLNLFPSWDSFVSLVFLLPALFCLKESPGILYYWNLVHDYLFLKRANEEIVSSSFFPSLVLSDMYKSLLLPRERHFRFNDFKEVFYNEGN